MMIVQPPKTKTVGTMTRTTTPSEPSSKSRHVRPIELRGGSNVTNHSRVLASDKMVVHRTQIMEPKGLLQRSMWLRHS